MLNRRGFHFFWLPFSIPKGLFCVDIATDFDSDDDDDDRLDNEDTTRERSWFPVCCIAFGHPGVTCYTLIHSLNCWGRAHNTQYIYISDTRGSLTIVYSYPIQWYTNSPTAGLVGKTICWGNNMFDLYNCLHTLVFFKVINSVPESMESSVTQSIQIYPENHEFDENLSWVHSQKEKVETRHSKLSEKYLTKTSLTLKPVGYLRCIKRPKPIIGQQFYSPMPPKLELELIEKVTLGQNGCISSRRNVHKSFAGKRITKSRAPRSRLKPSVVPTLMGVRLLPGVCTTRKL